MVAGTMIAICKARRNPSTCFMYHTLKCVIHIDCDINTTLLKSPKHEPLFVLSRQNTAPPLFAVVGLGGAPSYCHCSPKHNLRRALTLEMKLDLVASSCFRVSGPGRNPRQIPREGNVVQFHQVQNSHAGACVVATPLFVHTTRPSAFIL